MRTLFKVFTEQESLTAVLREAVLMQLGRDKEDAIGYLRRAVELLPEDQESWFGLGQALLDAGKLDAADEALRRVVEIQAYNPMASVAKEMRSRVAQDNYRKRLGRWSANGCRHVLPGSAKSSLK